MHSSTVLVTLLATALAAPADKRQQWFSNQAECTARGMGYYPISDSVGLCIDQCENGICIDTNKRSIKVPAKPWAKRQQWFYSQYQCTAMGEAFYPISDSVGICLGNNKRSDEEIPATQEVKRQQWFYTWAECTAMGEAYYPISDGVGICINQCADIPCT